MSTLFPNFRFMYSNVFALLLITLFIFKYSLSLHNNFTDSIGNISLIIPVAFSLFLRPDEQLHNLAVRLHCGQCLAKVKYSLLQGSYIHLTAISHPTETTFSQIRCGYSNKMPLHLQCHRRWQHRTEHWVLYFKFRQGNPGFPFMIYCNVM